MIRIGNLLLGKTPRIAASFRDKAPKALILWSKKSGLDLVEFRIDLFSRQNAAHVLNEIKRFRGIPRLATIRSRREGGQWQHSEYQRLHLYKVLLPHVDAVDIELSSTGILHEVIRKAKAHNKTLILSFHDFKKMPGFGELGRLVKKAKSLGADIVKIAAWASSQKDVKMLGDFTRFYKKQNLITIAMGEAGRISRITYPSLGSLLTFAHVGKASAPGQFDLITTRTLLRKLKHPLL